MPLLFYYSFSKLQNVDMRLDMQYVYLHGNGNIVKMYYNPELRAYVVFFELKLVV